VARVEGDEDRFVIAKAIGSMYRTIEPAGGAGEFLVTSRNHSAPENPPVGTASAPSFYVHGCNGVTNTQWRWAERQLSTRIERDHRRELDATKGGVTGFAATAFCRQHHQLTDTLTFNGWRRPRA